MACSWASLSDVQPSAQIQRLILESRRLKEEDSELEGGKFIILLHSQV